MARHVFTFVPILLLTLLCVGFVELFYRGVERYLLDPAINPGSVVEMAAQLNNDVTEPVDTTLDYSIITKRNLFGLVSDSKKTGTENSTTADEELEATNLDVVLMGTIGGGDTLSSAIILNKADRKQDLYKVGERIQGAVIKEIRRGKVILTIDDRDEMLDMSEAAQYGQGSAPPVAANPRAARRRVVPPVAAVTSGEQTDATKPRVVRPTRRIVRPRPVAVVDENSGTEEELPPELLAQEMEDQDVEVQELDVQEQEDAVDLENQEQNVEQQ